MELDERNIYFHNGSFLFCFVFEYGIIYRKRIRFINARGRKANGEENLSGRRESSCESADTT